MKKRRENKIRIFEGIFKCFEDTHVREDVFNENIWTKNSLKKLKSISLKEELYCNYPGQDTQLAFLISTITSKEKKITILDFGGGIGTTYAQIKKVIPHKNIFYYIIEKEAVCKEGSRFFKKDKKIKFTSSMPDIKKVDIVYARSSIRYVDKWKKTLKQLSSYNPKFFLIVDLLAGDVPPYVTIQNYYGGKIPCHVFNEKDFLNTMKKLCFEPVFWSNYAGTFFNEASDFPQDHFPKKYRVKKSKNILFYNKKN